jgi:hemolysin D
LSAVSHHWATIRRALDAERKLAANGVPRSQEPDFLPAALSVVETPVSPTARIATRLLLLALALTMTWLVFGKVDIVTSAKGRILPVDDVKLVQAATPGIVRHVWVHEGDTVRRGEPLVDLDPTASTADEQQAEKAMLGAQLEAARSKAVVGGLSGQDATFVAPPGTPPEIADTQRRLAAAEIERSLAETGGYAAARESALEDARAAEAQKLGYDDTVPVLDKELDAMNTLAEKGYAPGLKLLELQRQRRTEASSRDVASAQQAHGLSDAAKFGQQITQSRDQARQQALADLAKAQVDVMQRQQDLIKAQQRSRMQRLTAPVDGTVQQLTIHTIGGVVEAVRPLMVVVPYGEIVVEAHVLNRDAGFVRVGQSAAMKLLAFPFTRYGAVPGRIVSFSHDAVQDRNGSYYVARIALSQRSISTDAGNIPLTSGLEVSADIRIGSRSLISYLISPLTSGFAEAGREQ